jgi:3-ketosteroid 9alpha-monooxygenase subunit B
MIKWAHPSSPVRRLEARIRDDTAAVPSDIVMRLKGRAHTVKYHPGETLLETARRGGVPLGSSCEQGNCGTCMVSIVAGCVRMRANFVLSEDDVASGLALACQSIPTSDKLEIDLS